MTYRAVNCRSSFGIANADVGTGRCRLTLEHFKLFSIKIGWIVRISLSIPGRINPAEILCTAWPISCNQSPDDTVLYVDDSVQFDTGIGLIQADWIECDCKVRINGSEVFCHASLDISNQRRMLK